MSDLVKTAAPGSLSGVVELMTLVTRRFPPLKGHAHQLIMEKGRLQLNLVNIAPCWKITFSEEDLQKQPIQLFAQIVKLMTQKENPTPAA
jgi:hypothetical protein